MNTFTQVATFIGVLAVLYLVYNIFGSKKNNKNNLANNGGILVVFADKETNIADFSKITDLADWVYNDNLKGFEATNIKAKISLTELRQIFKDSYNLDNKQVSVQSIKGTWAYMIS